MQMSIPRGRIEWNLNTLIQLATLLGMMIGGTTIWVNASRDIEELRTWRSAHDQLHKERLVDVKAVEARTDERFRNVETEIRKISNLEYRLTVSEQSTLNVVESVKELQGLVNRQGSDLRLALEILQRMENRTNTPFKTAPN